MTRNGRLSFLFLLLILASCQAETLPLPTRAVAASVPFPTVGDVPPTWTPLPGTAVLTPSPTRIQQIPIPSGTPLPIPTNTPVTPSATPTETATATPEVFPTDTPVIKPIDQYGYNEVIPFEAFPVPANNNGWGMHWIANVNQPPDVVDRFVAELVRMHIKWVIFLNDGTDIGKNDYLVDKLVANGIMPVMRLFRSNVTAYDGDIAGMVRHYRAKGVYYFQLYNEPNTNVENNQGFANPNLYAVAWAAAARQVISAGGLPGIGGFSPGGEYDHNEFLDRTLRALAFNNDLHLLNHAWLSVHNYHGLRQFNDPGGFYLYRKYDEIVRSHLGRSLPIVGTEGGSYSSDPMVEAQYIAFQYQAMRTREPFLLAFSYWILANLEGGHHDGRWEYQALFRSGFVHPAVTEFFYTNQ